MAVHCISLEASKDTDEQKVKNKIVDLMSTYGEKLPKQDAPFSQSETMDGSTTFYREVFRVSLDPNSKTTEKKDLTEQIRKEMDKSASGGRFVGTPVHTTKIIQSLVAGTIKIVQVVFLRR